MFTRSNFDIKGEPICTNCKNCNASKVVVNTIINNLGKVSSYPSAWCNDCWNKTNQDYEDLT